MDLPPESGKIDSLHDGLADGLSKCIVPEDRVHAMSTITRLELDQFPL
jgi:hypothetical protein